MKHTGFSEWKMLLAILKDHRPHRNFDIPGEIKNRFYDPTDDLGMFPVAARIGTLREKKFEIKAGPPCEFGREIIREKDHYYQLIEDSVSMKKNIKEIEKIAEKAAAEDNPFHQLRTHVHKPKEETHDKQLTMEFMNAHRTKLDGILA